MKIQKFQITSQPRFKIMLFSSTILAVVCSFSEGQSVPDSQVHSDLGATSSISTLYGIDFSPYESGQNPNLNPQVSADQIRTRLQIVAPHVGWIRSFSSTTGLENIPPIAHSLGLKVAAGAWISKNLAQNAVEISSLITAANAGTVDLAVIGSEVLLRGDLSEAQLITYLKQVRQAIPASIPITTADTYATLLAHPNVIAATDVVMGNFYPYWEGQSIGNAVCNVIEEYNQLVRAAGGKPVIISETGWPSGGAAQGAAVPSPANAGQYALQFVSWARSKNVPYFYFEAFDEEWKAQYEGPQGAYWGMWDQTGALKSSMQSVVAGQVSGLVCNGIPGGSGTPQVFFTYVPPYGSSDQIEGQVLHVSTSSYAVVLYIEVSGGWWTKPTFAQPITSLQADGSWRGAITTGGSDPLANAVTAFLIPTSYRPPALSGSPSLPNELYQNSVAHVQISRSQGSISGRATDPNGLPLAGVAIALSGASNAQTNTAPDGMYSFPNLANSGPYTVAPISGPLMYIPASQTLSELNGNQVVNFAASAVAAGALRFVPVTPCRVADTRNAAGPLGGPLLSGGSSRDFTIPSSACGIPSTAQAYALNVTVVPANGLGYLTIWPSGQPLPQVSTLNSHDGRVKANAAIVPAGVGGAISVFASNGTHLVLDINGYFVPASDTSALAFYPLAPCRIADTRTPNGSFGQPSLTGGQLRNFPILLSSCNVPATAKAYSLNFTVVPKGPLSYLTVWPTGQSQPSVSTLNAPTGTVVANAAITPAGQNGDISTLATHDTDLVIDINGYFAPPATGGLSLYAVLPCRALDTRIPAGAPPFTQTLPVNISADCNTPPTAQAYVLNATVVPPGGVGFLTLWPDGQNLPLVSTLNAHDGSVTSNMALVPTSNGSIDAFAGNPTHLVLDLFGYFAP